MRVKIGATTLTSVALGQTTNANRRLHYGNIDFIIASTSKQFVGISWGLSATTTSDMAGFSSGLIGKGTATEDLTTAKTLAVTVQWGLANAATEFVVDGYYFTKQT